MTTEETQAFVLISTTKRHEELFPSGTDSERIYRTLAKLVHPDRHNNSDRERAASAFAKLSEMYSLATGKVAAAPPIVFGAWTLEPRPFHSGSMCDLFHAESKGRKAIVKLTKSHADNDLLEHEFAHLGMFRKNFEGPAMPDALERLESGARRANVLSVADGLSLAEITGLYPGNSLDFRHVVWMVNRSLTVLGAAHRSGLIHGAVVPEHLIFDTTTHAVSIVDWTCSVTAESQSHIPVVVEKYRPIYPVEILSRRPPSPGTDIYMMTAAFRNVASVPRRFKAMFDWCLAASPNARPQDAWLLQDKWKALAAEEYGAPKFVELKIPVR